MVSRTASFCFGGRALRTGAVARVGTIRGELRDVTEESNADQPPHGPSPYQDPAPRKPQFRLISGHLALLSAGLVLLVVAKIHVAAHGNAQTALAIAAHAGVANVTLSSLVQLYPYLLAGAALYLGFVVDASSSEDERRVARGLFLPVAVLAIPFSTIWGLAYVWLAGDIIFPRWPGPSTFFLWRRRRRAERRRAEATETLAALHSDERELEALLSQLERPGDGDSSHPVDDEQDEASQRARELTASVHEHAHALHQHALRETNRISDEMARLTEARRRTPGALGALVAFLGSLLLLQLLIQPPWVPRETISFADGSSATGYVLALESEQFVVMEHATRHVARVPVRDVTGREICAPRAVRPWFDATLMDLFNRRPPYELCS